MAKSASDGDDDDNDDDEETDANYDVIAKVKP